MKVDSSFLSGSVLLLLPHESRTCRVWDCSVCQKPVGRTMPQRNGKRFTGTHECEPCEDAYQTLNKHRALAKKCVGLYNNSTNTPQLNIHDIHSLRTHIWASGHESLETLFAQDRETIAKLANRYGSCTPCRFPTIRHLLPLRQMYVWLWGL